MHRSTHVPFAVVVGVVLLALGGCKEKEFSVAPISEKVTLHGKPLAGAKVKFQPISQGKEIEVEGGSYATTDAQGNFTLQLILQDVDVATIA